MHTHEKGKVNNQRLNTAKAIFNAPEETKKIIALSRYAFFTKTVNKLIFNGGNANTVSQPNRQVAVFHGRTK